MVIGSEVLQHLSSSLSTFPSSFDFKAKEEERQRLNRKRKRERERASLDLIVLISDCGDTKCFDWLPKFFHLMTCLLHRAQKC